MELYLRQCLNLNGERNRGLNEEILLLWQMRHIEDNMVLMKSCNETKCIWAKEAYTVVGNARIIHDALPNATFVGFTGTPISVKDRNTREVFGDYIDVYDMTQAVEDGATRPVYYESRVVHLKLDQNTLDLIDSTYDILEQQSNTETIEKVKNVRTDGKCIGSRIYNRISM